MFLPLPPPLHPAHALFLSFFLLRGVGRERADWFRDGRSQEVAKLKQCSLNFSSDCLRLEGIDLFFPYKLSKKKIKELSYKYINCYL